MERTTVVITLVSMDSVWLVLLSLALGLMIGAGFALVLFMAAGRGASAASVASPSVPDGVAQVIDAMESPGVVLDPSDTVVSASSRAFDLGLVVNGTLAHPALAALADGVRRSGEPVSEDLVIARGPFGAAGIYLSVRVARLGSRYILLLAEDRTESHRLEDVRRDFVANISHELKTPIGAVGLLAEAIGSAAQEPDQVRHFAERLGEESTRLARITQDIIDLSRLQATDVLAQPEILSTGQIIAEAIDQNRVAARANAVTLAAGGDKDVRVYGNERLLVVAVHNLIANAIQYSPANSRVGIGVRSIGETVEIAVTDQGEGIPEEDLDRVFERFFRVDQARSRHTGGSGLGLAIVKHAVHNHGGDVRVWSQPGNGSTFTIRLPTADNRTARPQRKDQPRGEKP